MTDVVQCILVQVDKGHPKELDRKKITIICRCPLYRGEITFLIYSNMNGIELSDGVLRPSQDFYMRRSVQFCVILTGKAILCDKRSAILLQNKHVVSLSIRLE